MLVNFESFAGNGTDTLKITVTNRANGILTFQSAEINDLHSINHNFNTASQVQGAFDYTFSVFHSPQYLGEDSTHVILQSNGGNLNIKAQFKNGILQGIYEPKSKPFTVYPNPASQKLYFKFAQESIKEVIVFNTNGQIIVKKLLGSDENEIDVSGFINGIYIAQFVTAEQIYSRKFVVKH